MHQGRTSPARASITYEAQSKNSTPVEITYTDETGDNVTKTDSSGVFSRTINVTLTSGKCYSIRGSSEDGIKVKLFLNGTTQASDSLYSNGPCYRQIQYCHQ